MTDRRRIVHELRNALMAMKADLWTVEDRVRAAQRAVAQGSPEAARARLEQSLEAQHDLGRALQDLEALLQQLRHDVPPAERGRPERSARRP